MASGDTVEQVKNKLSILDVVGPYVKLTKSGKYWRGLSPFNKEKSPSFFVNIERNSYYCFSSSQGGDIFTFIEKMEGVDFKGALKILAEKAGVEITNERGPDRSRLDKLREAMARAEAAYVAGLTPESAAYKYALGRGLTPESIKEWNLGYAPDAWRFVLESLTAGGFTQPELVAAGLIKEADEKPGTWYDRFRNRLMFPIRDTAGRTVAFTGRALESERPLPAGRQEAKYLNSPETELYKKHEILFGMDRAKDAIRTRGFALLVEGQMDLLLLHQIGFTNTVALSGTALSKEHLGLIKRYADNLMLALDADRAGLASSMKSALAALASGMRVKAVRLPPGKDPADLAKEDPKELTKRIADAQSIVEFFLAVISASEKDPHRLIMLAERTVLPLISAIQSPLEREHFVGVTARALGSTPEAVRAALPRPGAPVMESEPVRQTSSGGASATPAAEPQTTSARRAEYLAAIAANYEGTPLALTVQNEYSRIIGAPLPADAIPERALFEAGLALGEAPGPEAADDLIKVFEETVLRERLSLASQKLRQAEVSSDSEAIKQAESEYQELFRKLSTFS